jgi:hypothetical protein
MRTLPGKLQRDGFADPAAGTGDECDFSFEFACRIIIHGHLLLEVWQRIHCLSPYFNPRGV